MLKLRFVIAALFVVPAPAFAQIVFVDPPATPTATNADKPKSDWEKIECRNEDTLGSRLERHQVCLTKWQWWTYEQEAKERVQQWQIIGFVSH